MTLLEAPCANREAETDVIGGTSPWPYPEIVDGHALLLEGPGLEIEANEALVDKELIWVTKDRSCLAKADFMLADVFSLAGSQSKLQCNGRLGAPIVDMLPMIPQVGSKFK